MRLLIKNIGAVRSVAVPGTSHTLAVGETCYAVIQDEAYATVEGNYGIDDLEKLEYTDAVAYTELKNMETKGYISITVDGSAVTASDVGVIDAGGLYTATNAESAFAEVMTELNDHITDATDAHDASAISIVDTPGYFGTDNAQFATDQMANDLYGGDTTHITIADTAGVFATDNVEAALSEAMVTANLGNRQVFIVKPSVELGDSWVDPYTTSPNTCLAFIAQRRCRVLSANLSVKHVGYEDGGGVAGEGGFVFYGGAAHDTEHYYKMATTSHPITRMSLALHTTIGGNAITITDDGLGNLVDDAVHPVLALLDTILATATTFVNVGGGGLNWTLAGGLTAPIIDPGSVTINYTIGGVPGTVTDDGLGHLVGAALDPAGTNTISYATGEVDVTFSAVAVLVSMTYVPRLINVIDYTTGEIHVTFALPVDVYNPADPGGDPGIDYHWLNNDCYLELFVTRADVLGGGITETLSATCYIDREAEPFEGAFGMHTDLTVPGVVAGVVNPVNAIVAPGEALALRFELTRTAPTQEFSGVSGQVEVEWL